MKYKTAPFLTIAGDNITITADHVSYTGTQNDDTVRVQGSYDSVDGGAGNDFIYTSSPTSTHVQYETLHGGDGNDTIGNDSYNSYIYGDAGNDYISSSGQYNTIIGGSGDDHISVSADHYNFISGGDGNDSISASLSIGDTLFGGAGDDFLWLWCGGDNTGTPQPFAGEATLRGGAGSDTFQFTNTGVYSTPVLESHATVADFNVQEDTLQFFIYNSQHLSKEDLDVSFVTNGRHEDTVITLSSTLNGITAVEKITLVGVDHNEWALVHVA